MNARDIAIAKARLEYLAAEERLELTQHAKRIAYIEAERAKAYKVLDDERQELYQQELVKS